MAISPEREAALREVARSAVMNGDQVEVPSTEDILDIYVDVESDEEAERVIDLIVTADVSITWREE
jgi:hypothetical protein